jgi:hypothetical protein
VRRWRHPVGIVVLLLGLAVYALVMMWVGATQLPEQAVAQLAFYLLAGLAWVWPALRLVRWMGRDEG